MRKVLKPVVVALFFLIAGISIWRIFTGYTEKQKITGTREFLPAAGFASLQGDPVNLHDFGNLKPMVIIYFHPECEHCRYEAAEIGQNAADFGKCQLVMVTPDDSLPRIKAFCTENHLWEVDNIEILTDKKNHFPGFFGKTGIPSVFVYNTERKLIRFFRGETKIEAIINSINLKQQI
jgi:peroxiredoxin